VLAGSVLGSSCESCLVEGARVGFKLKGPQTNLKQVTSDVATAEVQRSTQR
jgi:hypothetical protein